MAQTAPVLDLDDLTANFPQVVIDGRSYALRGAYDLAPLEVHRYRRMAVRLDELTAKLDLSDSETVELEGLPDQICHAILLAPDDVQAKLKDWQRMKVIAVFWQ